MAMIPHRLIAFALMVLVPEAIEAAGSIAGRVTGGSQGEAIVGANVLLRGTTSGTTTDIQGAYRLRDVFPGTYTLIFSIVGYERVTRSGVVVEEGKETVLSVTLKNGSTVKYRIKSPTADALAAATKEGISKQKVSSWDMEQSGTILTIGESPLPLGVALKVSIDPTAKKD